MRILKFFAGWCAPCTAYAPTFEQAEAQLGFQYPDIKWESINVDVIDAGTLYNVTSIPTTLILGDNDEELNRMVGNLPFEVLAQSVMDTFESYKASKEEAATMTEPETVYGSN